MLDLLKKIGVPGTVAAVVASLVTMVPFLFQVDERYAKADDMEKVVKKLERHIEKQNRELAQLAGFQQAMITLIQQGRVPQPVALSELPSTGAGSAAPTPVPAATPVPRPTAAPRVSIAPSRSEAVAEPASAPKIEKPRTWSEINEGLVRQQSRLIKAD